MQKRASSSEVGRTVWTGARVATLGARCYDAGRVFEEDLVVWERHRGLSVALPIVTVVCALVAFAIFGAEADAIAASSVVVGLGGGLTLGVWFANLGGAKRARRVIASSEGITVDGERHVLARQIRGARLQTQRTDGTVTVYGAYGLPLFFAQVSNRDEGARFLRAIGHGSRRRHRFEAQTFAKAWQRRAFNYAYLSVSAVALAAMASSHVQTAVFVAAFALGFALYLYVVLRGVDVEIGSDGVLVGGRRKRWIPFRDVQFIEAHEGYARFVLDAGHVDVAITTNAKTGELAYQEAITLDAFLLHAREALSAHREATGSRDVAVTLGRADRKKDEWLAALRQLRDGDTAYRVAAVRDDDLWRVVEDPAAPEDARAAAAFILHRGGERDDATVRLRVVAQAVAAPRLRVALESDDEAVLEAFCEEPAPRPALTRTR